MSCISIDDTVEIEITDEIDPNLQDTSQYPLPLCAKHRRCGNINYNDYEPAKTTYYQEQTVGSQPVYYQTGRENSSRFLVCDQYNQRGNDYPDESMFMQSFQQHDIRRNFVRRVYSILSLQLLVTLGFMCICVFSENVREYIKKDFIGVCIACVTVMIVYFMLICYRGLRRMFPINFILLAILTLSFTYIAGALCCMYSNYVVLMSVAITAAICISISLCACQTVLDITKCIPFLCFMICISLIYIIILTILQIYMSLQITELVIPLLIGIIFGLYLMYDTQMIMGGRRNELSPEEYIYGALTLFVDIVQIMWAVMRFFGERNR